MNATQMRSTDPRLLLEAARVFNAAGADYRTVAEVVAEQALRALDSENQAAPEVRQAIIADAAALRLSGRIAGGYEAALDLLKQIPQDSDGRLHLLRALANGQKYRAMLLAGREREEQELKDLRQQIREDLTFAFAQNGRLKITNQHFWHPDPAALTAGADREDDLRAVYEDDPEFQKLVAPEDVNPTPTDATAGARSPETLASGAANVREAANPPETGATPRPIPG
jgi:hypothetical protein